VDGTAEEHLRIGALEDAGDAGAPLELLLDDRPDGHIEEAKAHHAHLQRKLSSLYYREQLTFYLNAGVKADALGESCWKGSFHHTRNSKISQPIQQLKPDTGSAPLHSQASIRKHQKATTLERVAY